MIVVLFGNATLANEVYEGMRASHHGVVNKVVLPNIVSSMRMGSLREISQSKTEYYINLVINPVDEGELQFLRQGGAQVVHQYELVSTYKSINVGVWDHIVSSQNSARAGHVLSVDEVLSECISAHRKACRVRK